jgi:hypothetical protein
MSALMSAPMLPILASVLSSVLVTMKLCATFVSVVMFLHLQCGGSCLGDAFGGPVQSAQPSGEPACHHHEEAPTNNNQPSHDAPCTRGQFIESKLSNSGKVVLQTASLLPVEMNPVPVLDYPFRLLTPDSLHLIFPPPVPISILRI